MMLGPLGTDVIRPICFFCIVARSLKHTSSVRRVVVVYLVVICGI